ncbi:MAG: hypothetical protein NUK62_06530 [Tenericutes bacterium]|nr:hypothetical protein [Mycoplasmatota bacterium]
MEIISMNDLYEKAEKFRSFINEQIDISQFINREGSNQWNLICSCMDWLSVSTLCLNNGDYLSTNKGLSDSGHFYYYVSLIDIILEAITQLHRIFVNKNTIPFDDGTVVFKNQPKELKLETDSAFFKTIKACFGSHSVNLRINNNKEKYCASWSGQFGKLGEMRVGLYPLIPGRKDTIWLDISYGDLKHFLTKCMEYLEILEPKILEVAKIVKKDKYKPIKKITDFENNLDYLSYLEEKYIERFYFNDFTECFAMYKYFFSGSDLENNLSKEAINNYKDKLINAVLDFGEYVETGNYDKTIDFNSLLIPTVRFDAKFDNYLYSKAINLFQNNDSQWYAIDCSISILEKIGVTFNKSTEPLKLALALSISIFAINNKLPVLC